MIFTKDGWRDERLDAIEQLGRNADNFAALSNRRSNQAIRSILIASVVTASVAAGMLIENAWTQYNADLIAAEREGESQ